VGRDVDFRELVETWGFSGVVLANGAWRDRAIPLEGADAYVDKGLVYQNPFIVWFNHAEEAGYDGPRYETPDGLLVEDDRLVGFRFRRTKMEDGRPVPTDETFERRGPLTVSSIGSIPQPIEGIALEGELFAFSDWNLGRLADYPTVFSAGNVATGKGNIIASRKHARLVSETISAAFLGLGDDGHAGEEAALDATTSAARETAHEIAAEIKKQPPITPETLAALRERVRTRQQTVGYDGNFEAWITANTPEDFA
jgi:hypothetical protein